MIQHREPIRHCQRLLLVMGDADEGDADPFLQRLQLHLHLLTELFIQRAQRLIQQ